MYQRANRFWLVLPSDGNERCRCDNNALRTIFTFYGGILADSCLKIVLVCIYPTHHNILS